MAMLTRENSLNPTGLKSGVCKMHDEVHDRFPNLALEAKQLPTGEWVVANPTKPLTEAEALKVINAYQTIQDLIERETSQD
jgi:hypothetical protein